MIDEGSLARDARLADLEERIRAALQVIVNYGCVDGAHHKMWVIDQAMRSLTGEQYEAFVSSYCNGENGPDTYEWDTGIAP